jgi:hypothetical protein
MGMRGPGSMWWASTSGATVKARGRVDCSPLRIWSTLLRGLHGLPVAFRHSGRREET